MGEDLPLLEGILIYLPELKKRTMNSYGFFRVAAATPLVKVADVTANLQQICALVDRAEADGRFPGTVRDRLYLRRPLRPAAADRGGGTGGPRPGGLPPRQVGDGGGRRAGPLRRPALQLRGRPPRREGPGHCPEGVHADIQRILRVPLVRQRRGLPGRRRAADPLCRGRGALLAEPAVHPRRDDLRRGALRGPVDPGPAVFLACRCRGAGHRQPFRQQRGHHEASLPQGPGRKPERPYGQRLCVLLLRLWRIHPGPGLRRLFDDL